MFFKKMPTSEQLFDFSASRGGGELVDNVQSCLVVRVAHVHIDARLETHTMRLVWVRLSFQTNPPSNSSLFNQRITLELNSEVMGI